MANSIETVLAEIASWYDELPGGTERPKLLSKLATLELCGWLEETFDRLAHEIAHAGGVDSAATVLSAINFTHGFSYGDHVRSLFLAIGGETLLSVVEAALESKYPGELERLKSELGTLWKLRCELAHGSTVGTPGQQVLIYAPSWSQNRQRILAKLIKKFDVELRAAI